VEFLCRPPAERCANDSAKYDGFCVNGICCHNKLLGQEFCASVSLLLSAIIASVHIRLRQSLTVVRVEQPLGKFCGML